MNFEDSYSQLNERQRKAVDTVYGPLMVVAGPGTGKTQLLSNRVGNILKKTDLRPYNILCLTFTTNGVSAMKKRLVDLIGAEGNDVEVDTFHSFAEKIIQRYTLYNEAEDYQFIDELDKRMIIRELLEELPFNTPLKKTVNSVDSAISSVFNFINFVKKEKYEIGSLLKAYTEEKEIKRNSEDFVYKRKSGKFNKGDFKEADWNKYEHKVDKHIQCCHLYKDYVEIISEKNLIDYDDLILKAIDLLDKNDDLRYDFQEQYQIIMVDEFQDTNGAQLNIINQLCRDNDEPNIMVVGDEDQSIFRFQGANLYNIFDFHKRYLGHLQVEEQLERIVVLDKNYRSTPIILEASRALIENNSERITNLIEGKRILKKLEAANPSFMNIDTPIDFIEVENKEDELIPIAIEVDRLIKNGVAPESIAVLFPTNAGAAKFSDYLKILNYSFELSKEENILDDKTVQSYLLIFQLIQTYHKNQHIDRASFGQLLLFPWAGCSLHDISRFWSELKEAKIDSQEKFIEYIESFESIPSIQDVIQGLLTCIKNYSVLPPERFLHYVLDSFGIKDWAVKQESRLDILQKIEVLDNFLKDFLFQNDEKEFSNFLARIEAYQREGIYIVYEKHFQSTDSIKLMTYHKSKGLEFDYVFVQGAGRYRTNNSNAIYIPESILELGRVEDKERMEQEKRRLLYVAMTRAKRKLYLTDLKLEKESSKSKNKFKSDLPIVSEEDFLETPDIKALIKSRVYHIDEKDYLKYVAVNQTKLVLKEEELFENQFLKKRLENYQLSHSSINTYLECPQKFYFEKIINIPSETSFAMTMGSFYHSVIEEYFKQVRIDAANRNKQNLIQIAKAEVFRYKNFMTDFEFHDVQKAIETNIPILFDEYLSKSTAVEYELEKRFETKVDQVLVNGVFDKVDLDESQVRIIDYKTGKKSNALKNRKLSPVNSNIDIHEDLSVDERYGGAYWRQANLYFILAKENFPTKEIKDFQFVFIIPEDHKIEIVTFCPDEESEQYLSSLVKTVHTKIKNREFPNCKDPDCHWCQKVSYRQSLNKEL